jgi:hypothetical protein
METFPVLDPIFSPVKVPPTDVGALAEICSGEYPSAFMAEQTLPGWRLKPCLKQ